MVTFKRQVFVPVFIAACLCAAAQDLSILPEDTRIIQSPEGGYNLYIRKKPDINSVLITETTRDPTMLEPNYTYRIRDYNSVNGDERRILNGRFMDEVPGHTRQYFLLDSTPEPDPVFGEAFRIFIPYILYYGYPESRHGEVQVLDGTFFNLRAFEKPYADYSGAFADNPYRLKVTQKETQKPPEPDVSMFMPAAVETFSDIANVSGGNVYYAPSPSAIAERVREILSSASRDELDIVFAIDATESMKNDIAEVRRTVPALLKEQLSKDVDWQVALVLYKDYYEDFLVKTACGFTRDVEAFSTSLSSFSARGGRDIPEAVYEAIDSALDLPWRDNAERRIVLIGDAPAHPKPRGKVTREGIEEKARELNVQVDAIILPHGETY